MSNPDYKIPAQTRIGHIHLNVSALNQAVSFYRDLPGFKVTTMYGKQAAFLRLMDAGYPLSGPGDHGVSEAIYLDDPNGNAVELYRDRPEEEWTYHKVGSIHMITNPLM